MSGYIGGVQLCRLFYEEVICPILAATLPDLPYAAALLGPGSEVLGYDTPLSTDHDWGPRLLLFLAEHDHATYAALIADAFRQAIPPTFHGYPTHFQRSHEDPAAPAIHRVEVHTTRGFFTSYLGFDPSLGMSPANWLITPQQTLLELTAGAVYHDSCGELTALRAQLAYYPRDLWLYLMAAQWQRISQQEAFVGRAGDVGDELGSMLVTATIVRDLMRLCFFAERHYAPYSKWFGTAFTRLACGPTLQPLFKRVLLSVRWQEREALLAQAYAAVAALHNKLGLTPPANTGVSSFYDRPYQVLHADLIAMALRAAIEDPKVRALPLYGAVDQLSDSTDFLGPVSVRGYMQPLYVTGTPISSSDGTFP